MKSPLAIRPKSVKATSSWTRPRFRALCVLIFVLLSALALQNKMASGSQRAADEKSGNHYTLGFALSPTYGTVAIRDDHGRLLGQSRVDADDSYIRMMKRLGLESSKHPSPPYGSFGELVMDGPRIVLRKLRKRFGLAASSDVGRLVGLVKQLKAAAEDQLSTSGFYNARLDGALLALPSIVALYWEDACDTLGYFGIRCLLDTHVAVVQLRSITAAFHGYGFGSCEHWRDKDACEDEYRKLPLEKTLFIEYSGKSLSVDWGDLRTVNGLDGHNSEHAIVDFDAGSEHSTDGPQHWRRIHDHIVSVVNSYPLDQSVTLVLLTGESTGDSKFQETVKAAVSMFGNPTIRISNPLYVVADGTSDLSWRAADIRRMNPDGKYFPCPPEPYWG